jgi:hypothetical protein
VYPKGFDSILNVRSCETLQQYKARTMDCGTKDSCDVSLHMQLQVESMSKKTKKQEARQRYQR